MGFQQDDPRGSSASSSGDVREEFQSYREFSAQFSNLSEGNVIGECSLSFCLLVFLDKRPPLLFRGKIQLGQPVVVFFWSFFLFFKRKADL